MKVSLKLVEERHTKTTISNPPPAQPLLLRTKIPLTIFGFPFLSGFTTSDHSNLSLSLRTNFLSGPSLKLSYTPSSHAAASPPPLTLTLKSGVSLSGSPNNSPLIISANFSLTPSAFSNPTPTFSLHFKPQFGDFSIRKCVFSDPKGNGDKGPVGLVSERSRVWKELGLEAGEKEPVFSGVEVMANTKMPVAKRVAVNLRWGVKFPGDFSSQLPYLSVNKIGIERVDEVKVKKLNSEDKSVGDSEMLMGMMSWMKRELESVRRENQEMKCNLQELNSRKSVRSGGGEKSMPVVQSTSGFDQWRNKKSVAEENRKKELKKVEAPVTDVESELQKAIMAASST
ncbi:hypothetical protein DCAR_0830999 [Daucus carota subsp. sativus]|uniref:Uncharacterized protein n=1 Tax=Daucus carota subsp. sativus TaxID=79200 RepID=A0A175YCW9_DAUCS|nr:PREDICTED: uncharacterized protein LOC108192745 [Daucus carota subsp. sativus]XP_017228407.1 PREDICTED: uncharacterized protein LOC108192745 [Daucus carota subsp. sativus]WOH11512.1 hypothetical protein DCAR_0830999 [Daucus carota subsp. sativus]